ncbi:unnamed protein product [Porites lobata]|uniref:ATP synthase F0 subunit 6 n=1 Tax=Porites lobata TaxID=104759 RepID=A0ABN8NLG7_9CNID|nr:unnamed protein product [Porites lobata]
MMLNSVLYDNVRGYKDLHFLKNTVCFLLLWLMLPFFALCYLVAPNCRISKLLNTPVLKFMSHTASFLWFLVLLILSSIQDKFLDDVFAFSPLDVFISLWVVGMLFQEGKEAYRQGKERYLSQYWNLVTLIMLGLFVISGVLWFIEQLLVVSGVKEAASVSSAYCPMPFSPSVRFWPFFKFPTHCRSTRCSARCSFALSRWFETSPNSCSCSCCCLLHSPGRKERCTRATSMPEQHLLQIQQHINFQKLKEA